MVVQVVGMSATSLKSLFPPCPSFLSLPPSQPCACAETGINADVVQDQAIESFMGRLRARFPGCLFVFMCENNLSKVTSAQIMRVAMRPAYAPTVRLHDAPGSRDERDANGVMTTNDTKQMGYAYLGKYLADNHVFFATNMVTSNDDIKSDKEVFKTELLGMRVWREEKDGKRMSLKISGKGKKNTGTDDLVMSLIIGLAKWAIFVTSPMYRQQRALYARTVTMGSS
jgi:hypothetical protein